MMFSNRDFQTELKNSLVHLESIVSTRMTLDLKAELLLGAVSHIAKTIADSVNDWSLPKPKLPLYSWQAWLETKKICGANHNGLGATVFDLSCKELCDLLSFGYISHRDNIY